MSPRSKPAWCSRVAAWVIARSGRCPSTGITSGASASRNRAILPASAVSGATVYASSAQATRPTSPPWRWRSRASILARACARRVGGRSGASIEEDRSSAITSGACDSQCGRASWRQPGPASASTASIQASDTPARRSRARPCPGSIRCGSRCASTASRQPWRRRRRHSSHSSGKASNAHSHHGRWKCSCGICVHSCDQILFMRRACATARPPAPAPGRHPVARDTARSAVAPARRSRKSAITALAAVRRSTTRPPSSMSASLMLPDRSTASIICRASRGGTWAGPNCCGRAVAAHSSTQASSGNSQAPRTPASPPAATWSRRLRQGTRKAAALLCRGGSNNQASSGNGNAAQAQGQAKPAKPSCQASHQALIGDPPSVRGSVHAPARAPHRTGPPPAAGESLHRAARVRHRR